MRQLDLLDATGWASRRRSISEIADVDRFDWVDRDQLPPSGGLCAGQTELFFQPDRDDRGVFHRQHEEPAKRICRACPVRRACVEYALATGQRFGIWGGLNQPELNALRTGSRPVLPPEHPKRRAARYQAANPPKPHVSKPWSVMPKATVVKESAYILPADTMFPARLDRVVEVTRTFQYKAHHAAVKTGKAQEGDTGSFTKWNWEFAITGGPFTGLIAYGDTDGKITLRDDDRVRQWAETLLGCELGAGDEFDTDVCIGLPCVVTVRNDEPIPRRDGNGNFYPCPVDEVFPADSSADFVPAF